MDINGKTPEHAPDHPVDSNVAVVIATGQQIDFCYVCDTFIDSPAN